MKATCISWMVVFALVTPVPRSVAADSLKEVDQLARDWVKMRVETTRLETSWRTERELLESTLAAMKEHAASLEEKRDFAKAKNAQEREALNALAAKNRTADDDLKACETRLAALTTKLVALRPSLPPRLSEALEMSYRSLADPKLSFGERMQQAMNVLNRCAQFDRVVTAGEDVLTLKGEPAAKSLDVIYWGLSCGYAIDRAEHKAWLGRPGADGWEWQPEPEAYDRVAHLLAIARDQADPAFVSVPVQITREVRETDRSAAP